MPFCLLSHDKHLFHVLVSTFNLAIITIRHARKHSHHNSRCNCSLSALDNYDVVYSSFHELFEGEGKEGKETFSQFCKFIAWIC
jgi:hypothetical protein